MNNFILNMLGKQPIEVIYNMLLNSNPQLKQTVGQYVFYIWCRCRYMGL